MSLQQDVLGINRNITWNNIINIMKYKRKFDIERLSNDNRILHIQC